MLLSREQVIMPSTLNRRSHNSTAPANGVAANLTNKLTKLHVYIGNEKVYRVSLKFLVDIGLVNQPVKLDLKIICTLETKFSKIFESNGQVFALPIADPCAKNNLPCCSLYSVQTDKIAQSLQTIFGKCLTFKKQFLG